MGVAAGNRLRVLISAMLVVAVASCGDDSADGACADDLGTRPVGCSDELRASTTVDGTIDAAPARDHDVAYLLPSELPEGFALRLATERTDPFTDYTVSWAPAAVVGRNREEASAAPDVGATLILNVGARYYLSYSEIGGVELAAGSDSAELMRDGEVMRLDFTRAGIPVTVAGREVSEEQLRAFAPSLEELDRDEWREQLGDRLLVDDGGG